MNDAITSPHRTRARDSPRPRRRRRWLRLLAIAAAVWLVLVGLPTLEPVRSWLLAPLVRHDAEARGDVAYVMSGGTPYRERLRAASDLYHLHRVSRVVIADDPSGAGYDFVGRRSETRSERSVRYLGWLGVPEEAVTGLSVPGDAWFGSLSEAEAFVRWWDRSGQGDGGAGRVVVVTSAPHTRRSGLCFRRALGAKATVQVYAASGLRTSAELHHPIWVEYVKYLVYLVVA